MQTYDKFAERYDRAFAPAEKWFLSKWREETLSFLPDNSKILEVGAGTGLNFRFYPAACNAAATEISFKMLEFAAGKTLQKKISLAQADAQELPFPAEHFDAAFATLVFCSIPNPGRAFSELRRVVKKGGKIILLEHVRPNGALGYIFDILNLVTVPLIEDHFNRRTAKLAKESGLKLLETKRKALGIVNLIICEN